MMNTFFFSLKAIINRIKNQTKILSFPKDTQGIWACQLYKYDAIFRQTVLKDGETSPCVCMQMSCGHASS